MELSYQDFLQILSPPVREKFERNVRFQERLDYNQKINYTLIPSTWVSSSFSWGVTPEGGIYWYRVYKKMLEVEAQ